MDAPAIVKGNRFVKPTYRFRKNLPPMLAIAALSVFIPTLASAQNAVAPQPAASPAANAPVLIAKIAGTFSTKKAKVGDTLTAKTVQGTKLPDGSDVPKGSKLIAKVTLATSKKDGSGTSILSFRFDQVELKGGATAPIHGFVTAIGPALPNGTGGLGQGSVMSRNGQGSSLGIDPNTGLAKAAAKDENDIAPGSTMEGVALGRHLDADWTTALRGVNKDIDLDSDIVIKVQLK
jgi:hypothetical protein